MIRTDRHADNGGLSLQDGPLTNPEQLWRSRVQENPTLRSNDALLFAPILIIHPLLIPGDGSGGGVATKRRKRGLY